jgi:hypothetical protein
MLELRLRSGQVISFDGRVVEVFAEGEASRRFHVAQVSLREAVTAPGGDVTVELENVPVRLRFAREEAPACTRFLNVLADARDAVETPP